MAVAERFAGHGFVFAVYPRFARQQHDRRLPAWALTVAATGFALYGLWSPSSIPRPDPKPAGRDAWPAANHYSQGDRPMNSSHTSTLLRDHDSARTDSVPGRAARLLARGPARMKSPSARWAVNVLAVAGAALMVWSSVIHLQLWSDGYRSISVIGPLFLIQGIVGIALAAVIAVFRRVVLMAAGAVTMAATAAGLLLSAGIGLFGYTESLAVPYAETSLVVEFTSAAVLAVAAAIVLAAPLRRRRS
jgi:hypothetical protein